MIPGQPGGPPAPETSEADTRLHARKPLTLAQLVERARRTDARVEEAEADLHRLEALQRQAHWAWFPKFETVLGFGRPAAEARNDGLGGPPTTEASFTGDWNFGHLGVTMRAEVGAVLPIYTFGKLQALAKAGDAGAQDRRGAARAGARRGRLPGGAGVLRVSAGALGPRAARGRGEAAG